MLMDKITREQTRFELKVKKLYSDGGKEFVNNELKELLGKMINLNVDEISGTVNYRKFMKT
jgi:hypothetical protein